MDKHISTSFLYSSNIIEYKNILHIFFITNKHYQIAYSFKILLYIEIYSSIIRLGLNVLFTLSIEDMTISSDISSSNNRISFSLKSDLSPYLNTVTSLLPSKKSAILTRSETRIRVPHSNASKETNENASYFEGTIRQNVFLYRLISSSLDKFLYCLKL